MLYWYGSLVIFNPEHVYMYGEDRIVNGGSIVFTNCIIAILTISRAIIQSCVGRSSWFSKRTELSSISNYCLSLVKVK